MPLSTRLAPCLLAALLLGACGSSHRAASPDGDRDKVAGVESPADLARMTGSASLRFGAETAGAFARAARARARLAAANRAAPIAGTGGAWTPYGTGPLLDNDPSYAAANGDGFGTLAGRINDLLYVRQTGRLYAAVAQGGIWESADQGASWRPIGDSLPITSMGAIGYTPAGGGALIAATGDMAFSNDYAGVGVWRSTDDGAHWTKSRGVPDGGLSFRVAVDPTNPDVVYVATGLGLFRSVDAGKSFTNVDLPTGPCTGNSFRSDCFFANVVTDVVVQPKDEYGHAGGAVIAALGWRDGPRPNFNGKPEAPANGLYRSDTGAPGTFAQVPDGSGFTASAEVGRVALGVADGPHQDSGYLYAVVQNARLFNGAVSGGEQDIPLVGTPSVLDGIYVSGDFGKTWKVMERRQEFFNPANGSALSPLVAAGIGPGYQVTYNEWIKPDPTQSSGSGVPTRVLLGMEEVWETQPTGVPQDGTQPSPFRAIGQYTANGGACLVVPEQCGAKQNVTPDNTTTHPDQHGVALVPDGSGGETLYVGNDGGAYKQHVDAGGDFSQSGWGNGVNEGFHTLLPYGASMARDGTVYAGLQDNGELKITPDGRQVDTYVGDGIFSVVDPADSNVAYGELPNAGTYATTDGGHTWSSIAPTLTDADFVAPLVMDPQDAKHLLTAGREIVETTIGSQTTSSDWHTIYDLGTFKHPGDATATAAADDPNNHAVALSVNGKSVYAGYCGGCDPVKLEQRFHGGIATDVGGDWHIAAAKGLPQRIVTSITQDPADPRTIYVTLGASAARFFAPIGSLGEDTSQVGTGHVFKSTDAGQTFTDISGDLPDIQATWSVLHNGQLVVGTAAGVYASAGTSGGRYAPLGTGLPPVPVGTLQLKPGDPDTLVAATYGRGVYTYRFADAPATSRVEATCAAGLPSARFARGGAHASRAGLSVRGTASPGRACGGRRAAALRRVRVALALRVGARCRFVSRSGRAGRPASCAHPRFAFTASGTRRWRLAIRRRLAPGRYEVWAQAVDRAGLAQRRAARRVVNVR